MDLEQIVEFTGLDPIPDGSGYHKYKFILKLSEIGEVREAIDESDNKPIEEWCVLFKKGLNRGILVLMPFNKMKNMLHRFTLRLNNVFYLENMN